MKKLALLAITVFSSLQIHAQSMALVKMQEGSLSGDYRNTTQPVCPDADVLRQISTEMYEAGNPKYIWVDLLIDGIIEPGYMYNLYIHTQSKEKGGNVSIPDKLRKQYVKKWEAFVSSVGETVSADYHLYIFGSAKNQTYGLTLKDISDPNSEFRQITKPELSAAGLNSRGWVRFYREILSDGLAKGDEPFDYSFSMHGYYINGKRMDNGMHEKYRALCLEEFGWDGDKQWTKYNADDRSSKSTLNSYIQDEMSKLKPLITTIR